jgi:hypothetical protein
MIGKHVAMARQSETHLRQSTSKRTIWRTPLKQVRRKFGFEPERATEIAKETDRKGKAR